MFLRVATRKRAGVVYQYLQLVEAYRENGRNRQRVLCSLGNLEQLRHDGQLDRLLQSLERAAGSPPRTPSESLRTERVLEFGGSRLAQALWEQFELTPLLRRLLASRRYQFDVVAALATMVFSRLLAPQSELGIFAWRDRVWWPEFAATAPKLEHLYRALDALASIKEPLEEALFQRLQNLFNLEVDVVFYDLTSTYFEGEGPPLAAYGYSRDKRPDRQQVLLALACDRHGFPIAHEVLAGRRADVTTVQQMIDALQRRFRLRRVVFVGDRGMVSAANLEALDQAGYEYLVGLHRERVPDLAARAPQDLSAYTAGPHKVLVHESAGERPNLRYLCCYSAARAEEERQIRQARIDRAQRGLTKLSAQVTAGRLQRKDKILPRVTAHLRDAHAAKYFQYEVDEGYFSFERNEARLAQEREREGRYFLLTNAPRFSPEEAVEAYFTLQEAMREKKAHPRLAATLVAVARVAEACKLRGWV